MPFRNVLEILRTFTRNLNLDSRDPRGDMNRDMTEYKARMSPSNYIVE
jgi:hypothetical protein